MMDLFSLVDTNLKEVGDIFILDTRFLTLRKLEKPEFNWQGKIELVNKEKLKLFLESINLIRNTGNVTLRLKNYGKGTWWPLKYIRISLQEGGYLVYDRYQDEIDYETLFKILSSKDN